MAQNWRVKRGTEVRYRNASNRVFHAIVTAVTNQTTVNLRVGNGATKLAVTGALRRTAEGTGAGWYRHGSDF
jgi:hypothetical protein